IGARASLYRLGQLQNWAAHYPESEASFRRLLELEERLLGKDDPASANTWSWLGLDVGDQRRFDEADQIFARAEALLKNALRGDDHIRYLNHRALVERLRGGRGAAEPAGGQPGLHPHGLEPADPVARAAARGPARRRPGERGARP